MVASRRQAAPGGTRSNPWTFGRATDAAVQIVHDRAAGATKTADRASRSRDERNNSTTGETVSGEREGSDERQDFEDTRDQGRQTQGEAAE